MLVGIERIKEMLRGARDKASKDENEKRMLSRVYFWTALGGGGAFFVAVAGRKMRINWWKALVILYGIGPAMKTSGTLGLMFYLSYL